MKNTTERKKITRELLREVVAWQNLRFGFDLTEEKDYGFDIEFAHFLTLQEAERMHRAIVCTFKEVYVTWDFSFHFVVFT